MRPVSGSLGRLIARAVSTAAAAGVVFASLAPGVAFAINCRVTVVALNFGTYMPLTPAHVDVNGQLEVRCQAQPGTFTVTIGPGVSGDQLARTLSAGGGGVIYYNLYRDAARIEVWGDGTPPTFTVSGARSSTGRPTFYNYPVYGRLFANQSPNPGIYNDNVLVTVLF